MTLSPSKKTVFIVAGEASGDLLGAGLIRELKKCFPNDIEFRGIAGEKMIEEGCESVYPIERLSVMGIFAVLKRYRELSQVRKKLIKELQENPPTCFIGIDAPEFNLDFELALKKSGIKTVHYVSPSVWAWRPKRIFKIQKAVDLMLCLFTFEEKFYRDHNVKVSCVGHPLADQIPEKVDIQFHRSLFNIENDNKVLAVLPGSRGSEIKYNTQPFIEAAYQCWQKNQSLKIIVPFINQKRKEQFESIISQMENVPPLQLVIKQSREVMSASDVILIASGTATLEAMLLKKPMVVGYKLSKFSYAVFSRMLKVKSVSLPNLLAGKTIVPELIQDECTSSKLFLELDKRLTDESNNKVLVETFTSIHLSLKKNADIISAQSVRELILEKNG